MERESFSSRLGFILISAGCAIGLGNVWRFPFITGFIRRCLLRFNLSLLFAAFRPAHHGSGICGRPRECTQRCKILRRTGAARYKMASV